MRWTVLIVLFLAASHVVSGQDQSSPAKRDESHAQSSKKPEPETPTSNTGVVVQQETAGAQNNGTQNAAKGYFARLVAPENLPNLILCLVGIGGIIVAVYTLKTIERQTKATHDAERAWVLVRDIGNPQSLYSPDSSYVPGIAYRFTVYGNTPARITRFGFRCHIVSSDNAVPPRPALPRVPDYTMAAPTEEVPETGRVIAPGLTFTISVNLESVNIPAAEYQELVNRQKFLCSYGFIEYTDAFHRPGMTHVCYVYRITTGAIMTMPDGTPINADGFQLGGPPEYNRAT